MANRAMPDFTPAEIVFMKQMVDEILLSDLKEISRQAALLIVPRVKAALSGNKQFTMSEAEKSISAFVSRKWLKFDSEKKNIRLTPRFIAEMQTYLHKLRSQVKIKRSIHRFLFNQSFKVMHEVMSWRRIQRSEQIRIVIGSLSAG